MGKLSELVKLYLPYIFRLIAVVVGVVYPDKLIPVVAIGTAMSVIIIMRRELTMESVLEEAFHVVLVFLIADAYFYGTSQICALVFAAVYLVVRSFLIYVSVL